MKNTLLALILMVPVKAFSIEGDFEKKMKEALHIHDTSETFTGEQAALQAFLDVAKAHKNEYLPYYWAAYISTQLANAYGRVPNSPENVNPIIYVDDAQKYLDMASQRLKEKTSEQKSDLYAMQGFIYLFHYRFSEDEEKKEEFKAMVAKEEKAALKEDPDNPLMYVLAATNLITKDANHNELLGAKVLLETAKRIYENRDIDRSLTTDWNSEWIDLFWLKFAKQKLAENVQT